MARRSRWEKGFDSFEDAKNWGDLKTGVMQEQPRRESPPARVWEVGGVGGWERTRATRAKRINDGPKVKRVRQDPPTHPYPPTPIQYWTQFN